MFLNNGDDTFRDIMKESGLSYIHNTVQAVFVDPDGDRLEDLAVAHDTGQVRTWKNLGGLNSRIRPTPTRSSSAIRRASRSAIITTTVGRIYYI